MASCMWIKYWVLILLALGAGTLTYAYNDPVLGWKVDAFLDVLRTETNSLVQQIRAVADGWIKER